MPEDVGGSPYPDGSDHGGADDAFAAVVFDEAFVRAAVVHEPSAQERMLAAVEARLEAGVAAGVGDEPGVPDDDLPEELRPYRIGEDEPGWVMAPPGGRRFGRFLGRSVGPRGRHAAAHVRWHRPVAWFLAVIMGLGVVAVAVAAVYRGTGDTGSTSPRRPDTGNVGSPAVDRPQKAVVTAPSAVPGG